ncbi:hypothetical protein PVK06_037041 [Gossypium arboreum]|uniref:Reverse transcriptase zinc-binding domain-containing protein n=1 Tax=Gossypium arboreum TaxID=29729 RepID=A0ABR0MWL5_GOSAR|nr:hypothetical protein PVK06_037041 [Gossypium arboreum]
MPVLCTAVSASPQALKRRLSWEDLNLLAMDVAEPRVLSGDFNSILHRDEEGGVELMRTGSNLFRSFIFYNGLHDMGSQGPMFTWNRGNLFSNLIEQFVMIYGIKLSKYFDTNRLQGQEQELKVELESILSQEEILRYQKPRSDWLLNGDRNMKFFHSKTLARRKMNRIEALKIVGSACRKIERITCGFIWGSNSTKKKPALVRWEDCCRPIDKGGQGVRCLQVQNKLFLLKLGLVSLLILILIGLTKLSHRLETLLPPLTVNRIVGLMPPMLDGSPDRLTWRWSSGGRFTMAETYGCLFDNGVMNSCNLCLETWKVLAPQRVRVFLWLLGQSRLLTMMS